MTARRSARRPLRRNRRRVTLGQRIATAAEWAGLTLAALVATGAAGALGWMIGLSFSM